MAYKIGDTVYAMADDGMTEFEGRITAGFDYDTGKWTQTEGVEVDMESNVVVYDMAKHDRLRLNGWLWSFVHADGREKQAILDEYSPQG